MREHHMDQYDPNLLVIHPSENSETEEQRTAAVLGVSLEDLENGWIPKSDIIKYANAVASRDDKTKETKRSTRYRPSLQAYPLKNLQNITTPLTPRDVIFFWHIPKASGSSVKNVLSRCFQLTRAEMKTTPRSFTLVGGNLVNFDTSTIAGIAEAKEMGLVGSGYVDVIVSSYLHEGSALFTERHRGRLFTIMRHPVDTAISLFSYLGKATWERNYNSKLVNMTLWDYAQSNSTALRIDNWMTRYLARKIHGNLEPAHLELAKEILEHKCLVGMMEHFVESMERIHSYLGLTDDVKATDGGKRRRMSKQTTGMECVKEFNAKKTNTNQHETFKPGDKEWDLLAKKNQYDMELFQFATKLWNRQGDMFKNNRVESNRDIAWNYRRKPPKLSP